MGIMKPLLLGGLLAMVSVSPLQRGYEAVVNVHEEEYKGTSILEQEIRKVSDETKVPIEYLRGIIAWECKNNFASKVRNRNGTFDYGPGLNSRWLEEFAWRFNDGKKIDPHSYSSIKVVGRILANNYKALHDWEWTLTSYRWGVQGTIMHGVDRYYVDNVKRLGEKGKTIFDEE